MKYLERRMNDCEERGREKETRSVGGQEKGEESGYNKEKKKAGAFDTGVFLQDTDNGAWTQLCIYTCTYAQRVCEYLPANVQ